MDGNDTIGAQAALVDKLEELYSEYHQDPSLYSGIRLLRKKHTGYLLNHLYHLPPHHFALSSSMPWMVYWILNALDIVGYDFSSHDTLLDDTFSMLQSLQNEYGGFGGNTFHFSHAGPSYAATLATFICAKYQPRFYGLINRPALREWVLSLKLPNGAFTMHLDGECDTRAVYCVAVLCLLCKLDFKELFDQSTFQWLLDCQSYEGGFGGTPFEEAHGGYTYCAYNALSILSEHLDIPIPPVVTQRMLAWAVSRQGDMEGGFAGRTNKLVDSCYGYWLSSILAQCSPTLSPTSIQSYQTIAAHARPKDAGIEKAEGSLVFHQLQLQEYLLIAAQASYGGFASRPFSHCDIYHTCYSLCALSIAQNHSQVPLGNHRNEVPAINPQLGAILP